MKRVVLLLTLICLSYCFLHAQWTTTLKVDDTNFYRLFKFGEDHIVATAEWSNIVFFNEDGIKADEQQLTTYGFLFSNYTANNGDWYLGGGCYFVIEDACPGNALYRSTDQGVNWERVESDVTFTGFGNIVGILPTDNQNELAVVNEYGGMFRINLITGTVDSIQIDPVKKVNSYRFGISSLSGKWTVGFNFVESPGVSKEVYYESIDKGLSWQEIKLADTSEFIRNIIYRPDDQLQIITSKLNVYLYKNSQTELLSTLPYQTDSEKIRTQAIPTKLVCYASTYDQDNLTGYIYQSTNGGLTWKTDATLDSLFIDHMVFTDQNNGLAIANYRNVLKRSGEPFDSSLKTITLFPNPTSSRICLDLPVSLFNTCDITLHDALGKMVRKEEISRSWINVEDLATGIYFLSITNKNNNQSETHKFFKY